MHKATRQQLAIIDTLESGKEVDAGDLIYAYRQLSTLYDQLGDVAGASDAMNKANRCADANAVGRHQFFIDMMEEVADIDPEALSLAYARLADAYSDEGNPRKADVATLQATTLRELFLSRAALGYSKNTTPRSARAVDADHDDAGVDVNTLPAEVTKRVDCSSLGDEEKRADSREVQAEVQAGAGAEAEAKAESLQDVGSKSASRKVMMHDSISSPVVRQRPLSRLSASRGGERAGSGSGAAGADVANTCSEADSKDAGGSSSSGEGKESKGDACFSFAADSKDPAPRAGAGAGASKSQAILRFADMKVDLDSKDMDAIGAAEEDGGGGAAAEGYDHVYADDDFAEEGPADRESTLALVISSSSPEVRTASKSKNPVLFMTWDGEESSAVNVDKLKRFLKAKRYIVFEHAGGDCTGSSAPIAGFDAANALATSASQASLEGGDVSPDAASTGSGPGSLAGGGSETSAPSFAASARAKVSQVLVDQMTISTVFVACVTRAFTKNLNCKKLTLRMRELQEELGLKKKKSAEMLYVMINGDFTTESQPYNCRSGWLGYLLRDSLWSPAWNHAHIAGAAEAIASTVNLRRNVVRLNPLHVLYIETRGQEGVCPPSQIG